MKIMIKFVLTGPIEPNIPTLFNSDDNTVWFTATHMPDAFDVDDKYNVKMWSSHLPYGGGNDLFYLTLEQFNKPLIARDDYFASPLGSVNNLHSPIIIILSPNKEDKAFVEELLNSGMPEEWVIQTLEATFEGADYEQ